MDKSGCIHLSGNAYPVAEHLVGKIVEVRFDPFDLSRVRLFEGGVCSQMLEPQSLVSQTFRKARPRKKETTAARESSVNYREQLAGEVRGRAHDTIDKVRGPRSPFLSQAAFFSLLQTQLASRALTTAEARSVESFFAKNAPFDAGVVAAALIQAVEAKGTSRHLRFYLEQIQSARLAEGKE